MSHDAKPQKFTMRKNDEGGERVMLFFPTSLKSKITWVTPLGVGGNFVIPLPNPPPPPPLRPNWGRVVGHCLIFKIPHVPVCSLSVFKPNVDQCRCF